MHQIVLTPKQQKYLFKLLGYDFEIQYRAGKSNNYVDAFSRPDVTASSLWSWPFLSLTSWMPLNHPLLQMMNFIILRVKSLPHQVIFLTTQFTRISWPSRTSYGFLHPILLFPYFSMNSTQHQWLGIRVLLAHLAG